jgi:hypothetical protein
MSWCGDVQTAGAAMKLTEHPADEYLNAGEKSTGKEISSERTTELWKEQVRNRAYELYLTRKGGPGSDVQDWLHAEAELLWKLEH